MLISEHAIASRLIPTEPIHCPGARAYLFPSRKTFDLLDQIPNTPSLGVVLYDVEPNSSEDLLKRLKDIIALIELAQPDGTAFRWLDRTWLEHSQYVSKLKSVSSIEGAVADASQVYPERDSGIQMVLPFEKCRCQEVARQGLAINFAQAIDSYSKESATSSLRALVGMAAFAFTAPVLLSRIYDNDLLPSSLLWSILDRALPTHSVVKRIHCQKCGEFINERMYVSTDDRIKHFVGRLHLGDTDRELMIQYLTKLYSQVRNPFYHKAAHETSGEAMQNLRSALGDRNDFTFADDVKHGRGSSGFQYLLQHLIRHLLFDRLHAVVGVDSGLQWPS
jgi:hypothetical protein